MSKISDLKTIYHCLIQSHLSNGICIYEGTYIKTKFRQVCYQAKKKNYDNTCPQTFRTVKHLFAEFKTLIYRICVLESIKNVREHISHGLFEVSHPYNTQNQLILD